MPAIAPTLKVGEIARVFDEQVFEHYGERWVPMRVQYLSEDRRYVEVIALDGRTSGRYYEDLADEYGDIFRVEPLFALP